MKRILRVVTVSCAVCLLSHGSAQAQALKFFISPLQAAPGQAVTIPVQVSGASSLGAFELDLVYDPAVFDLQKVEKGPLLSGNNLLDTSRDTPGFRPGRLVVALAASDKIDGDGVLLQIQGTVTGAPGQRTALTIENVRAFQADSSPPTPVATEVGSGELTLSGTPSPPPQPPPTGGGPPVLPGAGSLGPLAALVVLLLGAAALGAGILVLRRRAGSDRAGGVDTSARLEVQGPDGQSSTYRVTSARTAIGQRPDCDLPLTDPEVSKLHAEIVWTPGGFVLRDLDSTNGTWLNGQKVAESPLRAGDKIVLGSTTLTLGH